MNVASLSETATRGRDGTHPGAPTTARSVPALDDDPAPVSGLLFVLSGPSGVGKSTLIEGLKRDGFPITYCVTATTRPRRPNEVEGVHYYFLADETFEALLAKGGLLEHAVVHREHKYGIPRFSVRAALRRGHDVIMAPEVQGAATVRRKLPNAVTIFLKPPSLDELIPRLAARGTESEAGRAVRLETAAIEMERAGEYDYVIVNHRDRLGEALTDLQSIITAERRRVRPRVVSVWPTDQPADAPLTRDG